MEMRRRTAEAFWGFSVRSKHGWYGPQLGLRLPQDGGRLDIRAIDGTSSRVALPVESWLCGADGRVSMPAAVALFDEISTVLRAHVCACMGVRDRAGMRICSVFTYLVFHRVRVCSSSCACACVYTYTHTHARTHTYYTHKKTQKTYAHMYIHILCVCVCVCLCVCVSHCVCVCKYVSHIGACAVCGHCALGQAVVAGGLSADIRGGARPSGRRRGR